MTTVLRPLLVRAAELVALLFGVTTLLFFLLRVADDPATVIGGEQATPELLAEIRAAYGFDRPLPVQYLLYLSQIVRLEFGTSIANDLPALSLVLERLGPTLLLAGLALLFTLAVAVPLGAWLGMRPDAPLRRGVSGLVFVAQGIPGYVVGLLLIQLFAVRLGWLPSIGAETPAAWILPAATLAAFLVPKLTRVLAANVAEALREDYIRTARAHGAPPAVILLRHALPNALLGATALIGTQFAFLISGALTTEVIFAWPGLGRLLIASVQVLDFPVVQASVFVIAAMVFAVNGITDVLFRLIDPRLRGAR
jgi:peptide/nickel transport system permease protein